ncbi:MAG: LysR family transcriptional regulator ArgP [Betaproteobacteria bacterium]|nr:LysR family transcriptional regulator ArgP [Betaproteobacteria bacterium]
MLDPNLLGTVAAVIREGSFERAAHTLHVTASAVSQRIRQIEEQLGVILIVRGAPCMATDMGMRLCRHAETVAMLEHDLRVNLPHFVLHGKATTRSTLRVVVNADSLATWLMELIAAFAAKTDTLIDIAVDDQDQTEEWLRRGQAIAAVTSQSRPVQGFRARRLGQLNYVAVASPRFVARWFENGVTADALAQAPCLVFNHKDQLQERWASSVFRRNVALSAHRIPAPHAFLEAAIRDLGWGMHPRSLIEPSLLDGQLVEMLPGRGLDVVLYWQWSAIRAPLLDSLSEHIFRAAANELDHSASSRQLK